MSSHKAIMDGNEAAAYISYAFTEVAGIFPITPSSPMAEHVDEWAANGKKNLFGERMYITNASGCGPGDLLRRAKKPPAGRLGLNGPADSLRAAVSVIILNFSFFTLPADRRTSRARRAHESPRIQAEPGQSHQFSWIS